MDWGGNHPQYTIGLFYETDYKDIFSVFCHKLLIYMHLWLSAFYLQIISDNITTEIQQNGFFGVVTRPIVRYNYFMKQTIIIIHFYGQTQTITRYTNVVTYFPFMIYYFLFYA